MFTTMVIITSTIVLLAVIMITVVPMLRFSTSIISKGLLDLMATSINERLRTVSFRKNSFLTDRHSIIMISISNAHV